MLLKLDYCPFVIGPATTDEDIHELDELTAYKKAQLAALQLDPDIDPVIVMDTDIEEICLQLMLYRDNIKKSNPNRWICPLRSKRPHHQQK